MCRGHYCHVCLIDRVLMYEQYYSYNKPIQKLQEIHFIEVTIGSLHYPPSSSDMLHYFKELLRHLEC